MAYANSTTIEGWGELLSFINTNKPSNWTFLETRTDSVFDRVYETRVFSTGAGKTQVGFEFENTDDSRGIAINRGPDLESLGRLTTSLEAGKCKYGLTCNHFRNASLWQTPMPFVNCHVFTQTNFLYVVVEVVENAFMSFCVFDEVEAYESQFQMAYCGGSYVREVGGSFSENVIGSSNFGPFTNISSSRSDYLTGSTSYSNMPFVDKNTFTPELSSSSVYGIGAMVDMIESNTPGFVLGITKASGVLPFPGDYLANAYDWNMFPSSPGLIYGGRTSFTEKLLQPVDVFYRTADGPEAEVRPAFRLPNVFALNMTEVGNGEEFDVGGDTYKAFPFSHKNPNASSDSPTEPSLTGADFLAKTSSLLGVAIKM